MSDDCPEIAVYVRDLALLVRTTMAVKQAVPFLKGALALAGDHPAVKELRDAYHEISSADDQLEALAGQLKLPLDGKDGQ